MIKKIGITLALSAVLMLVLGVTGVAFAQNTPVSGAVFTTVNPVFDGPGHCLNGGPGADAGLVNCNIYDGKEYVWLTGGPARNQPALADGEYFFAVLVPGGQGGNENPNDGTENNLSDDYDFYTDRIFTVSGGYISYSDLLPHTFDNSSEQSQYGKIRLFPYADTTNPGGVYILAVCSLADGYPVDPSDCKYDAFKVMMGEQAEDLIVSKTAFPSYELSYTWLIDKSVDQTLVKQVGGSATFNYTVKVSHDAGTASNWVVAGEITVENPNAFDVSGVTVTDEVDNYGICSVEGGEELTVPGYDTVTLDYECTYTSEPEPLEGTNTATATWYEGEIKHVSGTADFNFAEATPNLIDECVEVTDSYAGVLGTVCVGDANPTSFEYSRTVTMPQWDCVEYDNTATFTTNDTFATASDEQSVKVCGPMKTGALTIGFWQNKNGQSIITNFCGGTSGTSLFTFLTGYAPFQDLSKSGCKDIASYVSLVIKAANSAGDSMNPMLKAQMLATALNVYFSDPLLGGNRIGAPAPIGGVQVDLTLVCTDLTCASYQDVSSVFGGSPKTVSEMLSYAASMSNVGGTFWYGNVKSTQELVKDAFDAINNQKVFAP